MSTKAALWKVQLKNKWNKLIGPKILHEKTKRSTNVVIQEYSSYTSTTAQTNIVQGIWLPAQRQQMPLQHALGKRDFHKKTLDVAGQLWRSLRVPSRGWAPLGCQHEFTPSTLVRSHRCCFSTQKLESAPIVVDDEALILKWSIERLNVQELL